MTIEEYFGEWCRVVDTKEADKVLKKLLASKEAICPAPRNVFKAFELCPYNELKLVILGQDPYSDLRNGKPVATGIAFANSPDTPEDNYSPSLDILRASIINFSFPHGLIKFDQSLEKLARQGILFLNSALTCIVGKPGSHMLMWGPFMRTLLQRLSEHKTGLVYVLMGSHAQMLEYCINTRFNHVIRIRHPAYYARTNTTMPSDVWTEVDRILTAQNGCGIKWYDEY